MCKNVLLFYSKSSGQVEATGTAMDIRGLKIYDGDVNDKVTSKYHLALPRVFRGYSVSFTSYSLGEVS